MNRLRYLEPGLRVRPPLLDEDKLVHGGAPTFDQLDPLLNQPEGLLQAYGYVGRLAQLLEHDSHYLDVDQLVIHHQYRWILRLFSNEGCFLRGLNFDDRTTSFLLSR